ncbi:hypothetical protein ACAX43_32590 [Paraburkholderia sp. IW21]|uniref:hypothetical protein n=1 Tax=Paraburkholderia sp. IW21 TaxID=3242488 RepID=UPI0035220447
MALHRTWTENLNIDLSEAELVGLECSTPDPRYQVANGKLEFQSLAARNQFVAEETALSVAEKDGTALFEAASELLRYETTRSDRASICLLRLAIESRDLLLDGATALRSGKVTPFVAATLLGEMLPRLANIHDTSLFEFCRALQLAGGGDIRPTPFFAPLVDELAKQEKLLSKVLDSYQTEHEVGISGLYGASLLSLANIDVDAAVSRAAHGLASSGTAEFRFTCAWVLDVLCTNGTIPDSYMSMVEGALAPILEDRDNDLHKAACAVVANALHLRLLCPSIWQRLLEEADPDALCALVPAIFRKYHNLKKRPDFAQILRYCLPLGQQQPSEIGLIDGVFSRLLSDGHEFNAFIVDWLTQWTNRHDAGNFRDTEFVDLFDQTAHRLQTERRLVETLVTRWLLQDGRAAPAAAGGLLSYLKVHEVKPFAFDIAEIDKLDEDGLIFLCRRLLGFVIDEEHLILFMLSLLGVTDAEHRTYRLFADIVVAEVGYDYPSATLANLRLILEKTENEGERHLISEVVAAIERFVADMERLPVANELWPPTRLARNFSLARDKAMRRSNRAAHEKSFMAQIAKQIPVKGGTGFFSYLDGAYTAVTRMTTISTSMTLPRREIFDPVGQALHRFNFQRAKRGDK